jgi:glutathione S-transferase
MHCVLHFAPGACSLAPHIILREAGLPFELVLVDLRTGITASGKPLSHVHPRGRVPLLTLPDGAIVAEGSAILLLLADLAPAANLAPSAGKFARVRMHETLNWIATELHKGFGPLFAPSTPEPIRDATRVRLAREFAFAEGMLADSPWLSGASFGVADAYLFTVLQWARWKRVDLEACPRLLDLGTRIAARPAVIAALAAERAARLPLRA